MHLIATDNGLLDQPVAMTELALATGERAEVLIDFSSGGGTSLISASNPNAGRMGGMMGNRRAAQGSFTVLPIEVDSTLPARITQLPGKLGGSLAQISQADLAGATRRDITLDMQMGMGMMMRNAFGGNRFSINGAAYDMGRLNFTVKRGSTEIWQVSGAMMMHPFHVHGVSFQVLSENGGPVAPRNRGWKDMVLVDGVAEIAMRFDHPAAPSNPYMFHCHILEHEDGGMMGQFAVV
jgi:FtsP/CotA-like multicopper oxidase with cupredoxin domain